MRVLTILMLLFAQAAVAQKVTLSSPDGKLKLNVTATEGKQTTISIDYGRTRLIDESPIGFEFDDESFCTGLKMSKGKTSTINDEYDLPVGKTRHVNSRSRQLSLTLTNSSGRSVNMILRAFNDGVAYRFYIPEQKGMDHLAIRNEKMELRPKGDPKAKFLILPGYRTSHEGVYTTKPLSEISEEGLIDMPALLEYPEGQYVAITESNVVDYAGMYLEKKGNTLRSRLSPRLDQPELSVIGDLPHRTPWRVFLVSDRIGALIESNIITTLADSCRFSDTSWLKPGKTTFTLKLSFLRPGSFELTLFSDAEDTDSNPNILVITKKTVTSSDTVNIHLAGSGGVAMILKPIR